MRMYDIIAKKRDGKRITNEEIDFFIEGYTNGNIPDYQVSALLMAIYFRGMDDEEVSYMTLKMARSGDMVDLSSIEGIKVDKHSTGGVGDKTTLVISSIVASLGVKVAKMSGRGLGHTGGTIDKMEAIPGMKTAISRQEFFDIVNNVGASIIGQSDNLNPADKKLYALRDVTAIVNSLPLIACSIMSKKIASGSNCILLDVKVGSGAFMKTVDEAIKLAKTMVTIGENAERRTIALITDMDRPLGFAIGNSLEIIEVIDTLKGKGPQDLTTICIELAANMLYLAQKGSNDIEMCKKLAQKQIYNGEAFKKLKQIVAAQGGDVSYIDDTDKFEKANVKYEIKAREGGYIYHIDTEKCGVASVELGAGRAKKEDAIDYSAGIILSKQLGDKVNKGDIIAILYSLKIENCKKVSDDFNNIILIKKEKPVIKPIINARVTKNEIKRYI